MNNIRSNSTNGNLCFSNAQLAEGTNAATIKTVAACDYLIGGEFKTKAATDNIAVTACPVQAAGTASVYVVSLDSSGNVNVAKGGEAAIGSGVALRWPEFRQQTITDPIAYANNPSNSALTVANPAYTAGTHIPNGDPVKGTAANTVIGAIKVVNATNPFTAGTTDLSAAGVTATYYNLASLSIKPLLA